jgi:hypothetical protein
MADRDYQKGRRWPVEKGISPERAERIAGGKLRGGKGMHRYEAKLAARDRDFWRGVWTWATEGIWKKHEPEAWASARQRVLEWIEENGELDRIDQEFIQYKHEEVPVEFVLTELQAEGLITRQRDRSYR